MPILPIFSLRYTLCADSQRFVKYTDQLKYFTSYRTFLIAHAQEMKRVRKSWSYGAWARSLGLQDPSSITKIIQGQRHPGDKITESLIQYFRFTDRNAQYFRDLVRLEKIQHDPRLSVLLMEKMGKEYPKSSKRVLDEKAFSVISNWYCLALREVVRFDGTETDAESLSKKFLFKVTAREIMRAIEAMIKLDLLKRDESGKLQLAQGLLDTQNDIANEAIQRYHEQMLGHAQTSIRSVPVIEREMSSTTLLMSSKNLSRAKELIREFREKFERILEEDSGDRVYQLQVQLFPMTTSLNERKKEGK